MKVYKATDKDMRCRGLQYEIGKTIEADGVPKLCENGLHACESPLELFSYYSPADGGRYFEAEAEDVSPERHDNSSKVVAKKLTLGAEIGIPGLVNAHIEYIKEASNSSEDKSSSGDWAKIGSSGDWAKIGSSGYGAQTGSSGYGAKIGSSGGGARIGSSGDGARIGSSGDWAKIGSSGYWAQIGSSGYGAKIGSSGGGARIGSSGDGARIGSSGDWAKIGSSGYWAQIGSSGYGAKIGSSGDWAKIGSSGDGARIDCSGKNSVVMCAGIDGIVKGRIGTWITLAEYTGGKCVLCKSAMIDGETLKADTWYALKNGEFVEVEE